MTLNLSPEQLAKYRQAAQQRRNVHQQRLTEKRDRAWKVASQAAELLRSQFGATQVALFGSMLRTEHVHDQSDLDLAVWGLDEKLYYRAVSHLLDLDPDLSIDLVPVELAKPHILQAIQREGVVL